MENQNESRNDLVKIKLIHLIRLADSFAGIEIHLFLSGKFIKMNYAHEQFIDILRKLQQKEVGEVYISQSDCKEILNQMQQSLSAKTFYDPSTTDEDRVEKLDQFQEAAKSIIKNLGVDKQTMDVIKTVNQRVQDLAAESPSIYTFIKRFKKNCSEQFMLSVITSYLTSLVIEQFPWKSVQVKEKAAMASLLCDITLNKEDFPLVKDHELNGTPLDTRIKNHPLDAVQLLGKKKDLVPSETITIIEQHHELPNGRGFPLGIESNRFNQLSSIFIVCQKFTEKLFDDSFDYTKRDKIIQQMQEKYEGRGFEKALAALIKVVA